MMHAKFRSSNYDDDIRDSIRPEFSSLDFRRFETILNSKRFNKRPLETFSRSLPSTDDKILRLITSFMKKDNSSSKKVHAALKKISIFALFLLFEIFKAIKMEIRFQAISHIHSTALQKHQVACFQM